MSTEQARQDGTQVAKRSGRTPFRHFYDFSRPIRWRDIQFQAFEATPVRCPELRGFRGIVGEARAMHMHVARPENATQAPIGKLVSPQKKLRQNLGRATSVSH